jgi:uncharacterized membrane protein
MITDITMQFIGTVTFSLIVLILIGFILLLWVIVYGVILELYVKKNNIKNKLDDVFCWMIAEKNGTGKVFFVSKNNKNYSKILRLLESD